MQPLDVTFFGPLKGQLNREIDTFLKSNSSIKVTPADVPELYNKAYIKVASMEKAVNGFRACGICPLNPAIFDPEFEKMVVPRPNEASKNVTNQVPVLGQIQAFEAEPQMIMEKGIQIPHAENVNPGHQDEVVMEFDLEIEPTIRCPVLMEKVEALDLSYKSHASCENNENSPNVPNHRVYQEVVLDSILQNPEKSTPIL